MKKYIIQLILLFWVSISFAQNSISKYEYWFDGDYANKTMVAIALTENFNMNDLISTTGLTDGVHTFNIRFQDDSGMWSSILSQFFYKLPPASTIDRKLSEYEYWFDGDYANKSANSVALTDNLNLNALIPTAALNDGVHTYNIRFKDNSGLWSSTLSQFFYKLPAASSIDRKLSEYEYWFDGDYANKTTSSLALTDNLNLSTLIPTEGLNDGVHTYNIRFKDNSGLWSSPMSQFFYKMPQQIFVNNKITTYRYWLDDNFADVVEQNFTAPAQNINLSELIDFTQITKGTHEINFQFKDSLGMWSVVSTDAIEKLSLPIADFDFTTEVYCDSTVVTFINKSIDGDEYAWDFGDGTTSVEAEPIHAYTIPGDFEVILTVKDIVTDVDSTISKMIMVNMLDVSVTQISNVLTANATEVSYQWLDCNNGYAPLADEINQEFTATLNGSYAVEISKNSCADTSACYIVTTVSIVENSFEHTISVSPNPTNGLIYVNLPSAFREIKILITDMNGKVIQQELHRNLQSFEVNLKAPSGIYFMNILTENKRATIRIIMN